MEAAVTLTDVGNRKLMTFFIREEVVGGGMLMGILINKCSVESRMKKSG